MASLSRKRRAVRFAQAGQAQMLAQGGGRGHVVVVEGDDAVDVVAAGQHS
jgi:hypothetical protein